MIYCTGCPKVRVAELGQSLFGFFLCIHITVSNLEGTETCREAIYYKHERAGT
jgi:hypothetical protein